MCRSAPAVSIHVEDIGSHCKRHLKRRLVTTAAAAPVETVNATSGGCNRGSHWQVWCF